MPAARPFATFAMVAVTCVGCTHDDDSKLSSGHIDASTGAIASLDASYSPASDATVAPDAEVDSDFNCGVSDANHTDLDAIFELRASIPAGAEREFCQVYVSGPKDLYINSAVIALTRGSHHGQIATTHIQGLPNVDVTGKALPEGVFPCEAGPSSLFPDMQVVAASQGIERTDSQGTLPDGVAFKIPANTVVIADFHMVNTSDHQVDTCFKVGVRSIEASQLKIEAGTLSFYNPFITIPPGGSKVARMACPVESEAEVLRMVSHMHARGVGFEATLLDGDPYAPDTKSIMQLYKTNDWHEPIPREFDPPLQLKPGQWIDYHCSYQNTESREIAQGLEIADEMCAFSGLYYPNDPVFGSCVGLSPKGNRTPLGYMRGDGQLNGEQFLECLLNSPLDFVPCGLSSCKSPEGRYQTQHCFTDTCDAVSRYTRPFFTCMADFAMECGQQCMAMGDTSPTCFRACLSDPARCGAITTPLEQVTCPAP